MMSNDGEPHHRIGEYDIQIVQGMVEVRGQRYEYAEFTAKDALSLSQWLIEHRDMLEQLAKESEPCPRD